MAIEFSEAQGMVIESPEDRELARLQKEEDDLRFLQSMTGGDEPQSLEPPPAPDMDPSEFPMVEDFQPQAEPDMDFSEAEGMQISSQDERFDAAMRGTFEPEALEPEPEPEPEPEHGPEDQLLDPEGPSIESEYERLKTLSPEQRMLEEQEAAQDRENFLLGEQAEINQRNSERIALNEANAQTMQQEAAARQRKLLAAAEEIGSREVDTARWWGSRSGGQTIALGMSAMLDGALNPGGRNATLDMVKGLVDQDIQAQVSDINNARAGLKDQRGIVGELYAQGLTVQEAAEAAQVAAYGRMGQELQMEAAKYDQAGTHARKLFASAEEWQAKQAEAMAGSEARLQRSALDMAEQRRKNLKAIQEQDAHNMKMQLDADRLRLSQRKGRGTGRGGPKALTVAEQIKLSEGGFKTKLDAQGGIEVDPNAKPSAEGELKEAQLANQRSMAAIKKVEAEQLNEGRFVEGLTTGPDGDMYQARTAGEGLFVAKTFGAVKESVKIYDQLIGLREKFGYENFGSEEQKLMESTASTLVLKLREAYNTGALDAGSVEILNKMITGSSKNPAAQFRSFIKAAKASRASLISDFNTQAGARKRVGTGKYKPWEAPPPPTAKTEGLTASQNAEGVGAELTPLQKSDPELKDTAIKEQQAQAAAAVRDGATPAELATASRRASDLIKAGDYTAEQGASILAPIVKKLAEHELAWWAPSSESKRDPKRDAFLKQVVEGDTEAVLKYSKLKEEE